MQENQVSLFKDKKFLTLLTVSGIVVIAEILGILGYKLPRTTAAIVFAGIILFSGREVLAKAIKAASQLNFKSINLLMFIAVVGAFFLKEYEEAAVVIVLFSLAERLEEFGFSTSKDALSKLAKDNPETALIKGETDERSVHEIQVGQVIVIKPSQIIPLDGDVVSGFSLVDESSITGEPIPKEKFVGDGIYAGSVNQNGYIEAKVTRLAEASVVNRIASVTQKALENKGETQKFIQKFSGYYTPSVMILALLLVVIPVFVLNQSLETWLQTSLSLLVIACPCALVISTPISIYSAMTAASRSGALIKGGAVIEELSQVRAVALDKTRTLTIGKPIVSDIFPNSPSQEHFLLACAAGMELFSEHPIAQSIVQKAKEEGVDLHQVVDFKSHPGKGASAKCVVCKNQQHFLGRLSFIAEQHSVPKSISEKVEQFISEGKTAIVVSDGKEVEGVLAVTDEIRPESADTIRELQKLGLEPMILTGDQKGPADQVAKAVGIKRVYAGLLPEDKAKIITQVKSEMGSVLMAGDGVNDAPALATANVGLAMAAIGSDAAIEASSIALMNDRLDLIPFLVRVGRKTVSNIKINTAFAIATKAIFVGLAIAGRGNLALAIFADVGVTLIVVLRSLSISKTK